MPASQDIPSKNRPSKVPPFKDILFKDMPFKDMQPDLEELRTLVLAQHSKIEALEALVKTLQAENHRLQAENNQLRRGAKRQAAPFSKGEPKANPKKPGRKPGSGQFTYRSAPSLEQLTEPVVEVPVTMSECPECGGELEAAGVELATRTELPAVVRPVIKGYLVGICQCARCGKRVRGTHPDLPADQLGATAHRLGTEVMGSAHWLHYGCGIPVCKVPRVLKQFTGIAVTQSALTQDALRRLDQDRKKNGIGKAYNDLRGGVKESERVYTDDTSWKVGGQSAYLMGFDTDEATVYQIRSRHRNEEVRELIPSDFKGSMNTDRGRSYDAKEFDSVKQQKCLSHVQSNLKKVLERLEGKEGAAREFAEQLKGMLHEAIELWRSFRQAVPITASVPPVSVPPVSVPPVSVSPGGAPPLLPEAALLAQALFKSKARKLTARITHHLRPQELSDLDSQRLLNELAWHHSRGNLLRFLEDPCIEPTNNRAERVLRPAVIARKVSHCSKNDRGARACEAFLSVVQTLKKRGAVSLIDELCRVFETGLIPSALSP